MDTITLVGLLRLKDLEAEIIREQIIKRYLVPDTAPQICQFALFHLSLSQHQRERFEAEIIQNPDGDACSLEFETETALETQSGVWSDLMNFARSMIVQ
jgi:hypothetical protein